jgi:hypothetical protein
MGVRGDAKDWDGCENGRQTVAVSCVSHPEPAPANSCILRVRACATKGRVIRKGQFTGELAVHGNHATGGVPRHAREAR